MELGDHIRDLLLTRVQMGALTGVFQGMKSGEHYGKVFDVLHPDGVPHEHSEDPRWIPFLREVEEIHEELETTGDQNRVDEPSGFRQPLGTSQACEKQG